MLAQGPCGWKSKKRIKPATTLGRLYLTRTSYQTNHLLDSWSDYCSKAAVHCRFRFNPDTLSSSWGSLGAVLPIASCDPVTVISAPIRVHYSFTPLQGRITRICLGVLSTIDDPIFGEGGEVLHLSAWSLEWKLPISDRGEQRLKELM